MAKSSDFIAVFDSGLGGITVLRALMKVLPQEQFLYFGDSKNAPYGTRTTDEVRELTLGAAQMLFDRGAKALVVACNTATAAAIETLREKYPDKIIVGIEPAVKVAADHFPAGRVGVMATPVTLREEKFAHLAEKFPQMEITPIGLGQLAQLIETGASEEEIEGYLRPHLAPLAGTLDAVVLGCTHYPLAAKVIGRLLGDIPLLDGAMGTALQTKRRLEKAGLIRDGAGSVTVENSLPEKEILARCMALLEENV